MLLVMRSYEVHAIERETDLDLADLAGLTDGVETEECANCWEAVGTIGDGSFEPFVITLTDEDEGYAICAKCSAPVIEPDTGDF